MEYNNILIPKKYSLTVDNVEFILDCKYEFISICN